MLTLLYNLYCLSLLSAFEKELKKIEFSVLGLGFVRLSWYYKKQKKLTVEFWELGFVLCNCWLLECLGVESWGFLCGFGQCLCFLYT